MRIGYFILNEDLRQDPRMVSFLKDLEDATFEV